MKRNIETVACQVLLLIAIISVSFSSCKKDEPSPVIVENPLNKEVYYIAGKVVANTKAIEGVKVSTSDAETISAADGTFSLAVKSKREYAVTFGKSGYVPVTARVTISGSMKKQGILSLIQELTVVNPSRTIEPNKADTIVEAHTQIVQLLIPVGAVTSSSEISITHFTEAVKKEVTSGSTRASFSTVSCIPDGLTFEKPVGVLVKNPTSSDVFFMNVMHKVEKNGTWNLVGEAVYNKENNRYTAELKGFSNHSFGPDCRVQQGIAQTQLLSVIVIDNLGKMNATEIAIRAKRHMGWQIEGSLKEQVLKQLAGLSDADATALSDAILGIIASLQGSVAGISEIQESWGTAKISGDMKSTVTLTEKIAVVTYSFDLIYGGKPVSLSVLVKKYESVDMAVVNETGTSHGGNHSGGSGF